MAGASLSTHVLDTHLGRPAAGVLVTLSRVEGERTARIAEGRTDGDGRVAKLAERLDPGTYRLAFDVGAYYRAQGATPLVGRVALDLAVTSGHYHVPLLASPFAAVAYRGS